MTDLTPRPPLHEWRGGDSSPRPPGAVVARPLSEVAANTRGDPHLNTPLSIHGEGGRGGEVSERSP
jgi:hypothetical protein